MIDTYSDVFWYFQVKANYIKWIKTILATQGDIALAKGTPIWWIFNQFMVGE